MRPRHRTGLIIQTRKDLLDLQRVRGIELLLFLHLGEVFMIAKNYLLVGWMGKGNVYQMSKLDDNSLRMIGCSWHRDISDRE